MEHHNMNQKVSVFETGVELKKGDYPKLFSACVGKVAANQIAFMHEIIGDKQWKLDLEEGYFYSDDERYEAQLIGNEFSGEALGWQWGWDQNYPIPEAVRKDIQIVKTIGEEHRYQQLTHEKMMRHGLISGQSMATVATALHPENVCYFCCPYEKGAAFIWLKNLPESIFKPVSALGVSEVCRQLAEQYPLHHETLVRSFLAQNHYSIKKDGNFIKAISPTGALLEVEFRYDGNIINMYTL